MFASTLSSVAKTQRGELGSSSQADAAVVPLARQAFLLQVGAGTAGQLLKVNFVGVEFRAVQAGETRLIADGGAATAAHAVSVHHDGIQAGQGGHTPVAREFRRRAPHGNGAHRVGGAHGGDWLAYHTRVERKPNGINGDRAGVRVPGEVMVAVIRQVAVGVLGGRRLPSRLTRLLE